VGVSDGKEEATLDMLDLRGDTLYLRWSDGTEATFDAGAGSYQLGVERDRLLLADIIASLEGLVEEDQRVSFPIGRACDTFDSSTIASLLGASVRRYIFGSFQPSGRTENTSLARRARAAGGHQEPVAPPRT
jgi:hypothetical protein